MRGIGTVLLLLVTMQMAAEGELPEARPADLGFDPTELRRIDAAVHQEIAAKRIPGAVVLVSRHGKIAKVQAYGQKALEPKPEPMTRDTIFDLASLTKPLATATSILILADRGKLKLSDSLGSLLPEYDNHGKGRITVEQLLRHRSGLIADNPLEDYRQGVETAYAHLAQLKLMGEPGGKYLYSDVNYIVLGRIVARLSGQSLNDFTRENVARPLGIDLHFVPDPEVARTNCEKLPNRYAPTERAEGSEFFLRGLVHDPRARALDRVAGHAGLFGTADDLAIFAQMLLDGGKARDGRVLLKPETVRDMIAPGGTPANERRGLGWDIDTPHSGPRGRIFGPTSFGHTGFTGTSLWIDPETDCVVILLTSRLHPDGKGRSPLALRHEIATIVGEAIRDRPARP